MGNNVLIDDSPRDTIHTSTRMLRMMQELFDGQKEDSFSDEAIGGIFFTLELVIDALQHANKELAKEKPDRDARKALMRDLFTRIYTVSYYMEPEKTVSKKEGTRTKEQAKKAMDGILDLATNIQHELGIGEERLFEPGEMTY